MFTRSITLTGTSTPELDFHSIQQECGLAIEESFRSSIIKISEEYHSDKRLFARIPTGDVKKKAARLLDAIDTLLPVLRAYHPGRSKDIEIDQAIAWGFLPEPLLTNESRLIEWNGKRIWQGGVDEHDVANYLSNWKKCLERVDQVKGSPGRTTNIALNTFLESLHIIYKGCGGRGRGCYTDRETSKYTGPFYSMALTILAQIDPGYLAPAGIGKAIVDIIPA